MAEDKTIDDIKGRAKEAVGAVTDDDDLRRDGELDQGKAETKSKVDEIVDKVSDTARDLGDKVKGALENDDDKR